MTTHAMSMHASKIAHDMSMMHIMTALVAGTHAEWHVGTSNTRGPRLLRPLEFLTWRAAGASNDP